MNFVSDLNILDNYLILLLCISIWAIFAQQSDQVELGKLDTGAFVSFVLCKGKWGIEIFGGAAARITQKSPAMIEVSQKRRILMNSHRVYNLQKSNLIIDAIAEIV